MFQKRSPLFFHPPYRSQNEPKYIHLGYPYLEAPWDIPTLQNVQHTWDIPSKSMIVVRLGYPNKVLLFPVMIESYIHMCNTDIVFLKPKQHFLYLIYNKTLFKKECFK